MVVEQCTRESFEDWLELFFIAECFQEPRREGQFLTQHPTKARLIVHQKRLHELVDKFAHFALRAIQEVQLFQVCKLLGRRNHIVCPALLQKLPHALQAYFPYED